MWDGDREQDGLFCASCSESLIQIDEDGEFVVKDEYAGKINYLDGDFSEEKQENCRTVGIVLEYSQNRENSHKFQ